MDTSPGMFGLGTTELLVVLALALIFLGPEKLPGLANKLGRFVRQARRALDDIKSDFKD